MTPFKFFRGNPYSKHFNRDLYPAITLAESIQPIKNAAMNAINICNIMEIRYENYEHYFINQGTDYKLKVLEIIRYDTLVHPYFIISYKMCRFNMDMENGVSTCQLRFEYEEYSRLLH